MMSNAQEKESRLPFARMIKADTPEYQKMKERLLSRLSEYGLTYAQQTRLEHMNQNKPIPVFTSF
jgi:hypothetical protein